MKKEIELRSDEVPPKSAQLRVHMGYILKSELGIDIVKTFTSGRTRGAEYWLDDKAKQRYSLELACKAAYTMIPQKKRVVDENLNSIKKDKTPPGGDKLKHKPNIEFILTDKNKLPVLEVAGRIDIHFHFHIS